MLNPAEAMMDESPASPDPEPIAAAVETPNIPEDVVQDPEKAAEGEADKENKEDGASEEKKEEEKPLFEHEDSTSETIATVDMIMVERLPEEDPDDEKLLDEAIVEAEKVDEAEMQKLAEQEFVSDLIVSLQKKHSRDRELFEEFSVIASAGDVTSVYRNRPSWVTNTVDELVNSASELLLTMPFSRPAVFHYAGLLVHESTQLIYNKRENPQFGVEHFTVKEAALKLIAVFEKYLSDTNSIRTASEILIWGCTMAAELSLHNSGRPCAVQAGQTPEALLTVFMSCEPIAALIKLVDVAIGMLLEKIPEMCMRTLFDASRHGAHFNWVWLHIALTFPGSIKHLLTTGVEQFKVYVEEIQLKKKMQQTAAIGATHAEYQAKFLALSDVFNFLMRNRNPELQDIVTRILEESINGDADPDRRSYSNLGLTFFLKLVTCSIETLRLLMTQNWHLVKPLNVIRGARQVLSVDPSLVLGSQTYAEFMQKIVDVIDAGTHGVVFDAIVHVAFDDRMYQGLNQGEWELEEYKIVRAGCMRIMELMVGRVLRVAHSPGSVNCPSEHPSLAAFAHGKKLHFLVDALYQNVERSSIVIRHLHAISIAFGELKAAEIVVRFLMTTSDDKPQYLYLMMAFVTTTAKFFPGLMETVWKEMDGLRILVEGTLTEATTFDSAQLKINFLHNVRMLFEWETQADDVHPLAFLRIYPGEHLGRVLSTLCKEAFELAADYICNDESTKALEIFRMANRLMTSVCSICSPKPKYHRRALMDISHVYKLLSSLAALLKLSLSVIGRDQPHGISVFEELRTVILQFVYNDHLDPQMQAFVPLFLEFFLEFCMQDARELFGETNNLREENLAEDCAVNRIPSLAQIEEGPSVLEGIKKIRLRESAASLAHSGTLKKNGQLLKRRHEAAGSSPSEILAEDQKQRVFVLLDALRTMCRSGSRQVQLINSKQMAVLLTETLCRNAVFGDYKFDDWEIESEIVSRYISVNNKIESSLLCDGVMRVLSETPSFPYCMPLLKAQLASILVEAETMPDRSRASQRVRDRLHRWVMLANRGGVLNSRYSYICDLEQFATAHETYLMVAEIWKHFQKRSLLLPIIDVYHSDLMKDEIAELPNESEAMETSFDVFRLIIQEHIGQAAHLFPKIFPMEFDLLKLAVVE